ncbi:EpsG family protein [Prevotella histicola]|uniref:EpsG family protein n=1 Tax=Prevotella histicola TaxID=470565 RepID=UPI001C5D323C|nr:EpsG family protein [Prevotella histicola]MBW4711860.1 EpsG family protein [Prevotella histicola]MBW4876982.1 EpsG family protein [Prevotella histicola]MBW4920484.1 EpsG family protein [Prevotella histicola]
MWLYLLIFFIPVFSFLSTSPGRNQHSSFLFLFLLGLSLFVGFSDMFGGYDRYIYGEIFDNIADITTIKGDYSDSLLYNFYSSEIGYTLLNVLISFFTENRYIFILIVTLIIYTLLFVSIKKYTVNYPLATILFLGLWFFFTFTYLRQVLGATIVWLGIRYVIERKFWKFMVVVLIGFSMHNSAIIFFPLYFIPQRKFSPKLIVGIMLSLLVLGLSSIPNSFFEVYESSSIVERHAEYNASGGLRVAYILEAFFFLYLILKNYKNIPNDKQHVVLLNMALVFCGILLLFVRSENGGRLSWYYMIGIISTLTFIYNYRYNIQTLGSFLIIGVCLFLYLRIYTNWQAYNLLSPYKTFLTDGYRDNDIIRKTYEYNYNYDEDKFCRKAFRFTPNF